MKKASVVGISSNSKLIVLFQQNKTFVQTKFQGFDISLDFNLRPSFDQLLSKEIQISYNKNQKLLRYQNESFFAKLIQNGALTLNKKQLQDSKLFTSQQKTNFAKIIKSQNKVQNLSSNLGIDLNLKINSYILQKLIKEKRKINAKLQYLSDHLLIRFNNEGKICFLKCKFEKFKHYFQLFPQLTFWKDQFLPTQISTTIISRKYNILSKTNEVFISLQEQIAQNLLKHGWVALNQKNYFQNSKQTFKKLANTQIESIKNSQGIYSSKSQILSFIYAKNNYVGIVTNILEGYIYEVTALKTKQVGKLQLPIVVCPIGQDSGAFQCRQFARKQLIGKQVNVYLHKEQGLNTTGNIIRIQDWKDIESVLLQNGVATVRDQYKNSMMGIKYSILQNKAKEKKKGIHKKDIGNRRFQDLTQNPLNKSQLNTYAHRRYQMLSKFSQNEAAVIEQIVNPLNYKIRIQSLQILINFTLQGIVQPFFNPNLKEYNNIKQQTDSFLKFHFHKRDVSALISDYDQQTNSYIGTLNFQKLKVDIQQLLIKASLVYADKYNFISRYNQLENQIMKEEKLIWQPQLKCFEHGHQLDKQNYCFEGRFSWILNGKIVYIQPKDNFDTIQKVQNKIRQINLQNMPKQKHKIGAWCAAPYEGQLYRAVIKLKKDNNVTVQFFDWGNTEIVKSQQLKQLPQEYLYLQKQCIRAHLNLVAKTKNKEALQKLRQILFDEGIYVFKKVYGDLLDFFSSEESSVNEELINKGLLKADKQQLRRYQNREIIKINQQELRKQRVGIWDQSQSSSDEQTQNY